MTHTHAVGGAFDACIGVPDLIAAIGYWELFGYRVGDIGALDAVAAKQLYGVDSDARMVRLWHQVADHGLIRLIQWEQPTGPGLGLAPFKTVGSRWTAAEVTQLGRIVAHAKYRRDRGDPIGIFHPDVVPAPGTAREPFRRILSVAMEMAILQPHYRQVLFERVDFPSPLYGKVNPGSMLQGSQFTHCCVVTRGVPADAFDFYDQVLGLVKSGDFDLPHGEIGSSGKDIFQLADGEGFHMHRFDDPRGGEGLGKRSGRVIFFNFRDSVEMPDQRHASRPGALGLCLYCWRVKNIEQVREVVLRAGATQVSDVLRNEFGERAVTLTAPDGTPWMLIDAADTMAVAA
ncbi:MAG: hypothetical protein R3F58_07160 [Steroidobacteraceae bacterium]